VSLDGRRRARADAYVADGTHDQALWHVTGLSPGRHTLRLEVRADADPRSSGRRIEVNEALVYRSTGR
ncbi:MAG: hypothetical protein J0L61_11190, partial [Planctomycetes bacterium]|nr:hypothetical protein [Planctomycetota bacterium]